MLLPEYVSQDVVLSVGLSHSLQCQACANQSALYHKYYRPAHQEPVHRLQHTSQWRPAASIYEKQSSGPPGYLQPTIFKRQGAIVKCVVNGEQALDALVDNT